MELYILLGRAKSRGRIASGKREMNICILSTSLTVHRMGGTEVHAEALAAEAARQGHEVTVVTSSHPSGLKAERKNGFETFYLEGTSHLMSRADAPAWWRASAAEVSRLAASGKADVVWAENFAGLSCAAIPRGKRPPVISVVQGLGIRGEIASRFSETSSLSGLAYFLTRYAAQTLLYYIPRFRAMVRDSDLLVGVSRETIAALHAEFPRSRMKTSLIFNPVDTGRFRPDPGLRAEALKRLALPAGTRLVMMAGVMSRQKGMHVGLEAFSAIADRFPEARLLIVGDGPERGALEAAAAGLKDRIIFAGRAGNADMPAHYNSADVYLNPTLRLEGLPLVIAEAMACGLPSVVSRIGGTASTIEDGISGFFAAPGDAAGLASGMEKLLRDPGTAAGMGRKARADAEARFSLSNAVRRYAEESGKLLGEGS